MVLTKDKYIIIGIFLLLLSLLLLVGFNLNRGGSIIENFQSNQLAVYDMDYFGDANLFQAIKSAEDYKQIINEHKSEVYKYNKTKMDQVLKSLQNNQIRMNNLKRDKQELNDYIDDNPPNIINTIKSNLNGEMLTVDPYDLNAYQIQINDKCLTVYDDNKYLLENCNTNGNRSDIQKFSTHRIRDMLTAKTITGKTPSKIAEYPYNIFKSEVTGQCLTLDDEGISVQNCIPDNHKQHFKVSEQINYCNYQ